MQSQHQLLQFDPATGADKPYPSHAQQWRDYHGASAWLVDPWSGHRRDARDVGTDPFGHLICLKDEPLRAAPKASPVKPLPWPPRMVKLDEHAQELPFEAAHHVAILLPDYGLIFDAREPAKANSWSHANQLASGSDLHGHADWRLPASHELQLLIRHDRYRPAIDTAFFTHTPIDDWYWTATTHASDSSYAWFVLFSYGDVYDFHQDGGGFVRAVRSVSPSQ